MRFSLAEVGALERINRFLVSSYRVRKSNGVQSEMIPNAVALCYYPLRSNKKGDYCRSASGSQRLPDSCQAEIDRSVSSHYLCTSRFWEAIVADGAI